MNYITCSWAGDDTNKIPLQIFILFVSCVVALTLFVYLNAQGEFPPGWTDPVRVGKSGRSFSLLVYDKIWLAFVRWGGKDEEIAISYSQDGIEWSTPYTFVEKSAEDLISPGSPKWLKRSNGDIWLLWSSGQGTAENVTGIVHYALLKEDGTFSTPRVIHSFDGEIYSFSSIANTSSGGLAMLEAYCPRTSLTIQGKEVQGSIYSNCVVQSADETLEWNPPFLLSQTDFAWCIALFLDDQGTIWAVYEESDPIEGTYIRTSEDGIMWSEPHKVPAYVSKEFLQRHNGEYVVFYTVGDTSVYMTRSPDGVKWSSPTLAAHLEKAYDLDVTESDDGTLWMVIEGMGGFYITQYTDEKYQTDLYTLRSLRIKNAAACGVVVLVGASLLFLTRKER